MKTIFKISRIFTFLTIMVSLISCVKLDQLNNPEGTVNTYNPGSNKSVSHDFLTSQPDILVTTTSDITDFGGTQMVQDLPGSDGLVSLREAIIAANNTTGPNVIGFRIPAADAGYDGMVFTIKPLSSLPVLEGGGTTINGATQKLFTGNTNPEGPEIVVDGSGMDQTAENSALGISSANNLIHCLVISNFFSGIGIGGPNAINNKISGCYIGVDPLKHSIKVPAINFYGIGAQNGVSGLQIGGPSTEEQNIVCGYSSGIFIGWYNNNVKIENNLIGLENEENQFLGNVWGISVTGYCSDIIIKNNNIRGNSQKGITLGLSDRIKVEGNYIDGASDINGGPQGIGIDGLLKEDCSSNIIIGGTTPEQTNTILRNPGGGIVVCTVIQNCTISGNKIFENGMSGIHIYGSLVKNTLLIRKNKIYNNIGSGISVNGPGTGYRFSQNAILNNSALGIELAPEESYSEGVSLNDPGDIDTGPNDLMNFPVLSSAKANPGQLVLKGTIDTPNPKTITIEFFANPVPDPGSDLTGYGEGAVYLGSVSPNQQGKFTATLAAVIPGTIISATATDRKGNTSEFSANIIAMK
jgi:hypothetical protein